MPLKFGKPRELGSNRSPLPDSSWTPERLRDLDHACTLARKALVHLGSGLSEEAADELWQRAKEAMAVDTTPILERSIADSLLNTFTVNTLRRQGVETMGQLLFVTQDEVLDWMYCGPKVWRTIEAEQTRIRHLEARQRCVA